MSHDWEEVRLSDTGRIVTGSTPPSSLNGSWGSEAPFITPSDINGQQRYVEPDRHLSSAGLESVKKRLLPARAVCFTCIGATIGKMCLTCRASVTNQQINSIIVDSEKFDPLFIYYALRQLAPTIAAHASGSATPIINAYVFGRSILRCPPLSGQRAIADVLGALDDKVEANHRTIRLEEELATRLLEQAPNRIRLGDVATVQRTIIDPAASGTTMVDHFSLPAFDERHLPMRQPGAEIKSGKQRIDDVAVLVSRLNPHIPRVWYAVPEPGVLGVASTEFVVMTPLGAVTAEELWACCNSTSFTSSLGESVTGTTGSHQRVQATDVLAIEVGDPSSIPDVHRLALKAMVKSACLLRKESVELTIVRDALLPKLLSGELRVRDAESLVEENDARILVENIR